MNKQIKRYFILFTMYASVLYPLWVRMSSLNWGLGMTLPSVFFPLFGLAAFSIMWLHVVGGAVKGWLSRYIDFDTFVRLTSHIVFVLIILHPLLLFFHLGPKNLNDIYLYGNAIYIYLAVAGWFLLIVYDIGRFFRTSDFFVKHWNKILFVSTIGFLLTFVHSIGLGSDLQYGPLRILWIFYGATATAATIYTFMYKPLFSRNQTTETPSF